MINTLSKLELKGNFLDSIKNTTKNLLYHLLNGEIPRLVRSSTEIQNKERMYPLTTAIQHCPGSPS